jgi:sec-independent protein translocase protein TatC
MSFWEHIDELRARLKVVALTALVFFLVLALFPGDTSVVSNPASYLNGSFLDHTLISVILHRIVQDLVPKNWTLIAASGLGEPLEIYFVASLIFALALAIPVVAYETYKFIDPALKENERGLVYPFVASSSTLFVIGMIFGYFFLARILIFSLGFFFSSAVVGGLVDAASFYFVIFLLIFASGVSFTIPVLVYAIIRLGVLDASFFSKNRVLIWVITFAIVGLFLTPDGGPLLDLVLFVPIVSLLELAVFLAKRRPPPPNRRAELPPPPPLTCKYCGETRTPTDIFCGNCGRSLA